jgi:hypothetical protein
MTRYRSLEQWAEINQLMKSVFGRATSSQDKLRKAVFPHRLTGASRSHIMSRGIRSSWTSIVKSAIGKSSVVLSQSDLPLSRVVLTSTTNRPKGTFKEQHRPKDPGQSTGPLIKWHILWHRLRSRTGMSLKGDVFLSFPFHIITWVFNIIIINQ